MNGKAVKILEHAGMTGRCSASDRWRPNRDRFIAGSFDVRLAERYLLISLSDELLWKLIQWVKYNLARLWIHYSYTNCFFFFCIMHILKYAGGLCLLSRSLCTSPSSITTVITNVLDSCEDISQAYLMLKVRQKSYAAGHVNMHKHFLLPLSTSCTRTHTQCNTSRSSLSSLGSFHNPPLHGAALKWCHSQSQPILPMSLLNPTWQRLCL